MTVIGTAGAGDAFNSTFAASIACSASSQDAMLTAAANAASVIGHLDTQTGLLRHEALKASVAGIRDKLKLRHWKRVL